MFPVDDRGSATPRAPWSRRSATIVRLTSSRRAWGSGSSRSASGRSFPLPFRHFLWEPAPDWQSRTAARGHRTHGGRPTATSGELALPSIRGTGESLALAASRYRCGRDGGGRPGALPGDSGWYLSARAGERQVPRTERGRRERSSARRCLNQGTAQDYRAKGVSTDTPLKGMYRSARTLRILDGPDEVHRIVIARNVLRRYRDGMSWDFGA